MLAELPTACDIGCKKNSKGCKETWNGLQTASRRRLWPNPGLLRADLGFRPRRHVTIPLMTMTSARIPIPTISWMPNDAAAIHDNGQALGHMPIIDGNFHAQHEAKANRRPSNFPEDRQAI